MIPMKPWIKKIRLLLSSASVLFLLAGFIGHWYWLDGIKGLLLELVVGKTEFSPKYKERNFARLAKGVSSNQVVRLLGEPLRRLPTSDEGEEVWHYTNPGVWDRDRTGGNCCYTERYLFIKNGVVAKVVHDFYFD